MKNYLSLHSQILETEFSVEHKTENETRIFLSTKQMQEATQLFENDMIQELGSESWLVNSTSGNGSY